MLLNIKDQREFWHTIKNLNLSEYLKNMLNNFLQKEKVPQELKTIILAIKYHKKEVHTDKSNYRGIAVPNAITKLFACILHKIM